MLPLPIAFARSSRRLCALALCAALASPPVAAQEACAANLEQTDACTGGTASPDMGSAPSGLLPSATLGNPVSLVTGAKRQQEIDVDLDGAPLGFRRLYDSLGSDADIGVGRGWRHSYAVALYARADGGREIVESSGRHVVFRAPSTSDAGEIARYRGVLGTDGHLEDTSDDTVWHLTDGRHMRFRGRWLARIEWPGRRYLDLRYGPQGLARIVDETGRELRLEYAPGKRGIALYEGGDAQALPGHLVALVLPDGGRIEYAYGRRGNLTQARFPDGTVRRYHYEDAAWPNHLTGLTERTGTRFATWAYDDAGRAVLSGHAGGAERVTLGFETPTAIGEIGTTTVTDSLGSTSRYTWRRDPSTGSSLLLTAGGPGCATCPPTGRIYTYTDEGRLDTETRLDDVGHALVVRRYAWTPDGRLESVHETLSGDAARLVERREYARPSGLPTLVARPSLAPGAELVTETVHADDGSPLSVTERGFAPDVDAGPRTAIADEPVAWTPILRRTTFGYESGRLASIDGPHDDVDDTVRIARDESGCVTSVTPPASPTVHVTGFDASGRPRGFRIGTAGPWTIERDIDGRVARVRQGGLSVAYEHDAEGRLIATTDTDGRTVSVERDAAGRAVRHTDGLGRAIEWLLDGEGRTTDTSVFGIDGSLVASLARTFDAKGLLTATTWRHVDGRTGAVRTQGVLLERDAAGRAATAVDPATGASTSMALDSIARLTELTRPDGAITRVEHDAHGRHLALIDARGNRTVELADDFGRVVRVDSPDTGTTVYEYDAAGNRTRERDESGRTTTYAWDAADRLLRRDDADGATSWRYGTEGGGHGQLVETVNAVGTERFAYDGEGRLALHERRIDGHAVATRYTHDDRGRLTSTRLPNGQVLRHRYHESGPDRGALRAIVRDRWIGIGSETLVGDIDLDGRDGEAGWTSLDGRRTVQRTSPGGELRELSIGSNLHLEYALDAAGRIVGIAENGVARRFEYTSGRLTLAASSTEVRSFLYDAAGNRTESVGVAPDGTRTMERYRHTPAGSGNRLLSRERDDGETLVDYAYRTDGAPVSVGDLDYVRDAQGRAVEVRRAGTLVATYAYNGFGERVRKTVHGPAGTKATTYFLYEGTRLVAEADERGTVTAQYLYLSGHRPAVKLEGDRAYAIHTDHRGAPLLMSAGDGTIVWQADHAPFGDARIEVETVALPLRLPGQHHDAETGTHYNYHRDYDPATGRYLTSDPIGLDGGDNTYAYVDGDPLGRVDPLGLLAVPLDPAYAREFARLGLGPALQDATRPGRILIEVPKPGVATSGLTRGTARVLGIAGIFYTAYNVGYEGARLVDRLVLQPRDFEDLVASIRRYEPRFEPTTDVVSPESIRALSVRLHDEMYAYLGNVSGDVCPVDRQLDFDTRFAVYGSRLGPSAVQEAADERLVRQAYEDYKAGGGRRSFEDWKVELARGTLRTYPNLLPERLAAERQVAQRNGVQPLRPGTLAFDEVIESGERLIWAIDRQGQLVFAPRDVNGESINHSILVDGAPVLSAGEAEIVADGTGGYVLIDLTNQSGHYRPSLDSLELAKPVFENHGIRAEF